MQDLKQTSFKNILFSESWINGPVPVLKNYSFIENDLIRKLFFIASEY